MAEEKRAKRILVIEDEKLLAEMYEDMLKNAGFQVFLAFDSIEGFICAREVKPDLILLDILLPRESGIFFLAQLRREVDIASTPVVVFSNYDDQEAKRQAMKLGAKEYLIKSNYTPKEIVEKIKQYVGEEA